MSKVRASLDLNLKEGFCSDYLARDSPPTFHDSAMEFQKSLSQHIPLRLYLQSFKYFQLFHNGSFEMKLLKRSPNSSFTKWLRSSLRSFAHSKYTTKSAARRHPNNLPRHRDLIHPRHRAANRWAKSRDQETSEFQDRPHRDQPALSQRINRILVHQSHSHS